MPSDLLLVLCNTSFFYEMVVVILWYCIDEHYLQKCYILASLILEGFYWCSAVLEAVNRIDDHDFFFSYISKKKKLLLIYTCRFIFFSFVIFLIFSFFRLLLVLFNTSFFTNKGTTFGEACAYHWDLHIITLI